MTYAYLRPPLQFQGELAAKSVSAHSHAHMYYPSWPCIHKGCDIRESESVRSAATYFRRVCWSEAQLCLRLLTDRVRLGVFTRKQILYSYPATPAYMKQCLASKSSRSLNRNGLECFESSCSDDR
jgi:hypothetical protein